MEKKEYLIVLWLLLNLSDFYLTVYALNLGGYRENNQFMAEHFLLGSMVKVFIVPLGLLFVYDKIGLKALYFINISYILVVSNNIFQLLI